MNIDSAMREILAGSDAESSIAKRLQETRIKDAQRIVELEKALRRIAGIDPDIDSDEGFNEWSEAYCFRIAQEVARAALEGKS